jgi:seryl-tRNA synthetase
MSPDTQQLLTDRTALWRGAVEQELQSLIATASQIRKEVSTAKTATKKKYFSKKFKSITTQVMQMLTALERVKAQQSEVQKAIDEPATEVSNVEHATT